MKNKKKDLMQFLVWMRNGTAFSVTWFLVLLLLYDGVYNIDRVSTEFLGKLVLLCIGGVFLFCVCFTKLVLRKESFVLRLTCFMLGFSLYECFGFYVLGVFDGSGKVWQWLYFAGIVLALYLCCIGIYQIYSKRQGRLYTKSLQAYQQRRREEYEK